MRRAVTYRYLAGQIEHSAARLEKLQGSNAPAWFVQQNRAILERQTLRLLEAIRHADDPHWRWDLLVFA